jgi:ABC-type branched-subunit amino acid transport system ATPase component
MRKQQGEDEERFEQATRGFPELDEPARRRAADRSAAGEQPQAALAREFVLVSMVRAYNP